MLKAVTNILISLLIGMGLFGCAGAITENAAKSSFPENISENTLAAAYDLPRIRPVDHRNGQPYRPFATYGQCQIELSPSVDKHTGLPVIADDYAAKIDRCLSLAVKEKVQVLILPELSLAFPEPTRAAITARMRKLAADQQLVIIAGSFYDENSFSRIPVIGPGWEEYGFKVKPSRFEASPRYGFGMREGRELLLLDTIYGRIVPLTCVDLISDAVQYSVRNLATRGKIDMIANLNYNPAAWEFLIEGNGIVRRHPVALSITNAAGAPDPRLKAECLQKGDNGYCFGNSALFASLREKKTDWPNSSGSVSDMVAPVFKNGNARSLPYDNLIAVVSPFKEAMLIYDLNLRLLREPAATNAPDQGYPVVRNVRQVPLSGD